MVERRAVLITGSTRGLGRALALRFAESGCAVILHGRDMERLVEVHDEIETKFGGAEIVSGDITDMGTIHRLAEAFDRSGADTLINNAGLYLSRMPGALTPWDVEQVLAVNLTAPLLLTLAVYPVLQKRAGLVVNINSLAGKVFSGTEAVYCASKWGLRGFMGSFKYDARKHGVRVLDVYLGAMRTEMTEGRADHADLLDPALAAEAIFRACLAPPSVAVNEIEIGRMG